MKKIFNVLFLFSFISMSFLYARDIISYKTINMVKRVSQIKKRKIQVEKLFDTEEKIENYVSFLLESKSLDIDNDKIYETMILEKKNCWLILLFEKENIDEDYIIDSFDTPLEYILYLDKRNGKLSKVYLVLDR